MTEILNPSHHGAIGIIALCYWKPLFLTCGKHDMTLKIWNYKTIQIVLEKRFTDNIYSMDIHPTGN